MIAPFGGWHDPVVDRAVSDRDELKQAAGERAVDWVESGMVVGLGTGSTAVFAIRRIGALVQSGELPERARHPDVDARARRSPRRSASRSRPWPSTRSST